MALLPSVSVWCWAHPQDSLERTNGVCVFCLNVHPFSDLPHGPLYPRHLSVISKMAENDSAQPPPPLHPPRAGCQNTPISDSHRAAVPRQCSNLFISHFLKQKTTAQSITMFPVNMKSYLQTSQQSCKIGITTSYRYLMIMLDLLIVNFLLPFLLGILTVNVRWPTWRPQI